MRILSLRFKNLNSLAGEWKIDFTDPEYVSAGIFAITGPTGAGKSTILDAISLALYGRTPRLGKISKNAGEIMSRQTGEYFSEVEFVSDKGQYRCTWSQNRAHKKPDGDLQSPRHEIVDAKTGVPLESKQAAVQQKVIDVTGLDYSQFTRSILLAQGEFATFLDAKAEERAPILEKITGTEIYGEISKKVHERFVQEKGTLDDLAGRADTLGTITPEQAAVLKEEKERHEREIRDITGQCKEREMAVAWLDTLAALKKELADLQERALTLDARKTAAADDLSHLSLARKARDLEGMYSSLASLREQQAQERKEKTAYEERLTGFFTACTDALEAFQLAEERYKAAAGEKQREDELARRVRDLDTRIREVRTRCEEHTREKKQLEEETGKYREAIRAAEVLSEGIRPDLAKVAGYLREHPLDEKLIATLSGIESAIRQIHATEETAEKKQGELRDVEHALADAEQVVFRRKSKLDKAAEKVQSAIASSDRIKKEIAEITGGRDGAALRLLAEGDADREHGLKVLLDLLVRIEEDTAGREKLATDLDVARGRRIVEEGRHAALIKEAEQAADLLRMSEENRVYLARIKSLEDARQTLLDNKPCPLCGSIDHPWCSGVVPLPGDAEKKFEAYKRENKNLQVQVRKSEADLAGIDAGIRAGEIALREREEKAGKAAAELEAGCLALGIPSGPSQKTPIAAAQDECRVRLKETRAIISRAEEKERDLKRVEQTLVKERDARAAFQRDFDEAFSYRDAQNAERNRLTAEIAATGENARRQKDALLESVQEYDVLVFSRSTMTEEILAALTSRRDEYVACLARGQELQDRLRQCEAGIDRDRSLLLAAEKRLATLLENLDGIKKEFADNSARRRELYGEKVPDAEEARVAGLVTEADKALSAATEAKNLADTRKTTCGEQIRVLAAKIDARVPVLAGWEQKFSDARFKAGFSREDDFLSARLAPGRLTGLETLESDIKREEMEISVGLKERTEKLAAEQNRALTQEKREDLSLAIENDKNRITRFQIEIGGIRARLGQYDEQVEKLRKLLEEIAKQKKEFSRWEKLHDLIGSADGKKFRIFAQGLTFETLVVQANRHLRTMSDRYLLIRNKGSSLDLDIVDNYQAGEIRTTKNLSGGERFIVSLALALGLSGMASHNVRIDSLFLDEGFGTLDEDTLESALETLSKLQREGKIIGIISHVAALKERIPVQIQVEKTGCGRSRLFGPGCSGPVKRPESHH
ncbi:AAA family ATPase [Methanoregula sp.]|uniref:AAA family ATPase n=1 Tax=Methanoregula sp. TaxID=2052170 RepID=UPI0035670ED9